MPRTARAAVGGVVYHVINRGNGRMRIFHKPADYDAYVKILLEGLEVVPTMRVLGYCLMPNHWHLVLWPRHDGDLSRYLAWVSNTHVRRYRRHYHDEGRGGHLYQGRFKSFPVQSDGHLLAVLRYVEANALRRNWPPMQWNGNGRALPIVPQGRKRNYFPIGRWIARTIGRRLSSAIPAKQNSLRCV